MRAVSVSRFSFVIAVLLFVFVSACATRPETSILTFKEGVTTLERGGVEIGLTNLLPGKSLIFTTVERSPEAIDLTFVQLDIGEAIEIDGRVFKLVAVTDTDADFEVTTP